MYNMYMCIWICAIRTCAYVVKAGACRAPVQAFRKVSPLCTPAYSRLAGLRASESSVSTFYLPVGGLRPRVELLPGFLKLTLRFLLLECQVLYTLSRVPALHQYSALHKINQKAQFFHTMNLAQKNFCKTKAHCLSYQLC